MAANRLIRVSRILRNVTSRQNIQNSQRQFSASFNALAYKRQILSEEELKRFNRDGYLVLPGLLTPQEKADTTNIMNEIQAWPNSDDKWFIYYEHVNSEKVISRVEKFYEYHPRMKALVDGKLGQAVADCVGEDVVMLKDKINFKMPGSIGYDAHQDEPGYDMFPQGFHVSALVPADDLSLENGCLKLVAGDWREGNMLPLDENGDIPEEIAKSFNWDAAVCEAGTVILFTSLVPHKSEANKTGKSRRAFYLTFNGVSRGDYREEFYNLRRELFPSDHPREPNKDYTKGVKLFREEILEMGKGNMDKVERGNY